MNLRKLPSGFAHSVPAIILGLFIVCLAVAESLRSYRSTLQHAEREVKNLAHALSEQTARTIQSIDLTLETLTKRLASDKGLQDDDAEFRSELRARLRTLPYVRALFVIGPDGYIPHDTDYPSTPRVSLADRSYFKAHQADRSLGLHIDRPLISRSVGLWFVSMSRRIDLPDGSFGGVVVAAVEPLYFEDFYRPLLVGQGAIALLLTDGVLIARSPNNNEAIGKSYAAERLFKDHLPNNRSDVYWNTSPIDGVSQVLAYRALENAPVVMLVTQKREDVLRSWRSHLYVIATGAGALLLMLVTLESLAYRQRQRETVALARLEQAGRLEAIGRFASGVAHDFGNVMRIMRSAIALLKPAQGDARETEKIVTEVERSLAAGLDLVDRLLSYARKDELRPQLADPDRIIEGILPFLELAAGPKCGIFASLNGRGALALLAVPEFEAVMVNLVLNSRDAMPAGGRISIRSRAIEDDEPPPDRACLEIAVEDEGEGMSEQLQRQALDPFFSTKARGAGYGIGLSQVRDFADRSGARLLISDRVGRGTSVRLLFPADMSEERRA